jgi:membrane protein
MKRHAGRAAELWKATKSAFKSYLSHDPATLGAGLAYYTVFSMAPLLVLVVSIAGLVFGPDVVSAAIRGQMEGLVGPAGAAQVETMMQGAYRPGEGTLAALIAAALLFFGATAVFGQLRTSLNYLWNVKPKPHAGYAKYLFDRVASFGMAACLAFLLLVSLVVHAGLVGAGKRFERLGAEATAPLLQAAEVVVSFGLTVVLFAVVYKFLSDAKPRWRDVWPGAFITALLFAAGKYVIGAYLGARDVGYAYGVAGSFVVILMWVYYSSQILFFGAELTHAFAAAREARIVPSEQAVRSVSVEVEKPSVGHAKRRRRGHA